MLIITSAATMATAGMRLREILTRLRLTLTPERRAWKGGNNGRGVGERVGGGSVDMIRDTTTLAQGGK